MREETEAKIADTYRACDWCEKSIRKGQALLVLPGRVGEVCVRCVRNALSLVEAAGDGRPQPVASPSSVSGWTTTAPTKAGYYWIRAGPRDDSPVCEFWDPRVIAAQGRAEGVPGAESPQREWCPLRLRPPG